MQRGLIIAGLLLLAIGISWPLWTRLRLGRLPGDFYWRSDNVAFYFPLTTSLLVSLVLGLVFWLVRR
ncbi:MAG TPA: DUF2905 domain-containing protein [Candidatus Macondimonas sp.]|nr:DUF2905 domain-containing protein [Candidatus Macondimonas sp.]